MRTNNFGLNLKAIRTDKDITQEKLSENIDVSITTISLWENQGRQPKSQDVIDALCNYLDVKENDLFGFTDGYYAKSIQDKNLTPVVESETKIPIYGTIAAGEPNSVIEWEDQFCYVSPDIIHKDKDSFALIVKGESMNQIMPDGSYAIISPNSEIKSNDIVAIKVNGDEATVKVIKFFDGFIVLEPRSTDKSFKRRVIDENDPDAPYVHVLGKVIKVEYEL